MLNGLSKTLLKYPVPVMTVIMLITGLFFWIAFFSDSRLQVDFSLEQMFPERDPEKDAYDSFIEEFNREDDKILLVYDCDNPTSRNNIAKIAELTEMMELDVDGVEDVISLSSIDDGDYFSDELTENEWNLRAQELLRHPIYPNLIISHELSLSCVHWFRRIVETTRVDKQRRYADCCGRSLVYFHWL